MGAERTAPRCAVRARLRVTLAEKEDPPFQVTSVMKVSFKKEPKKQEGKTKRKSVIDRGKVQCLYIRYEMLYQTTNIQNSQKVKKTGALTTRFYFLRFL